MNYPASRITLARQISKRMSRCISAERVSTITAEAVRLVRDEFASPELASRIASARALTLYSDGVEQ